jgi:uncharacterized protein YxjI
VTQRYGFLIKAPLVSDVFTTPIGARTPKLAKLYNHNLFMRFHHNTLNLRFKLIALAPQISVEDTSGVVQLYVRQKLLKLKESVSVFTDDSQKEIVYKIDADRVIDFRARYTITDASGRVVGAIKQRGLKSIWRVHFDVEDSFGRGAYSIEEKNPWVRVLDSLFESIPLIGALSGYLLHPTYLLKNMSGEAVGELKKQPALFEGVFALNFAPTLAESERELLVLSTLMMTLLERARG